MDYSMAPTWVIQISCLFFSSILLMTPCGMSKAASPNTADFWHKFCRLFCPFPAGCSADVYLSLQQKQMLLERKGLLATLQSFPQLLQDSDKLQHTALVTLEEHQRALVLMRYKDFFHPRETLPSATVKPNDNAQVTTSVTLQPDVHKDAQQVQDAQLGLKKEPASVPVGGDMYSEEQMRHHVDTSKRNLLTRTPLVDSTGNTFQPHVTAHPNDLASEAAQISIETLEAQSQKWNETNNIPENIEGAFDILKFQQILSAIPDAVLFNALCKKCAASVRKHPIRRGRKLLRLILQNNSDGNSIENIINQERDKFEFRTQSELFNSIGRPEKTTQDNSNSIISNAIDYNTQLVGLAHAQDKSAPGKSQSLLELHAGAMPLIPGLPENANYQSIADQFRRAEEARHQQHFKRRRKRMVMKTQVCPVVQSWSNLVLAKTANGTLVQIAQFPEVNLEQWFLEEKCKYPISPILDDVTCEARDRLVDAVIIPVSNPTLPIQTMKIKIQCCVSMYNLDDGRN